MTKSAKRTVPVLFLVFISAYAWVGAQAPAKKPLGVDDYTRWRSINGQEISGDGAWVTYGVALTNVAPNDTKPVLHLLNLATGQDVEVPNATGGTFSADSKWIAYTINTRPLVMTVSAYSIDQAKSFPITDGLSAATEPVFDASGKNLYLLGSTDAGPALDWFSMSNADMRVTRNVYLVVLRKDLPSPLAKESDEMLRLLHSGSPPEDIDQLIASGAVHALLMKPASVDELKRTLDRRRK